MMPNFCAVTSHDDPWLQYNVLKNFLFILSKFSYAKSLNLILEREINLYGNVPNREELISSLVCKLTFFIDFKGKTKITS